MVFKRTPIPRQYKRYEFYRQQLRQDFRYRCAYCTRQEGHNGGEANFCIDHFRPKDGPSGRSDLVAVYANLYWCCRECNDYKAAAWPSEAEQQLGMRFLDPCNPLDDHDLHWLVNLDGSLEALTNAGQYTIDELLLERPHLQDWRRDMRQRQIQADTIQYRLAAQLMQEERGELEQELADLRRLIEPPVFIRPRVKNKRLSDIVLPQDPFA